MTFPSRLLVSGLAAVAIAAATGGAVQPATAATGTIHVGGTLSTVVDGGAARPAAGLDVVVYGGASPSSASYHVDDDGILDGMGWGRLATVTTDGAGGFELSSTNFLPVPDSSYSVQLWVLPQVVDGVSYSRSSSEVLGLNDGERMDIEHVLAGTASRALSVSIVDSLGRPATGASVEVYERSVASTYQQRDKARLLFGEVDADTKPPLVAGTTDSRGTWTGELPPGDYTVFGSSPSTGSIPAAQAASDVTVGDAAATVTLTIVPEAVFAGRVVTADGSPAADYCLGSTGWAGGDRKVLSCTGADGVFRLFQPSADTGTQDIRLRIHQRGVDIDPLVGEWDGANGIVETGATLTVGAGTVMDDLLIRLPGDGEEVAVMEAPAIAKPATAKVGAALTATAGAWVPEAAGAELRYRWNRDGAPIEGADALAYTPVAADLGHVLTFTVSGTASGYAPATATSAPTSAVVRGQLPTFKWRVVSTSGVLRSGKPISISVLDYPADATYTYQWTREGKPIEGATDVEYTPGNADVGYSLHVHMTVEADGYEPKSVVATTVKIQQGW